MKPVIISVLNQKGGVGKTTTTVNLGAGLARKGKKVLLIDIDVQCNLTHSLIGDLGTEEPNICEYLLGERGFEEIIRPTTTPNLFVVPAGESVCELDLNLSNMMGREQVLKNSIKGTKGIESFDVVLIDNPPFLSLSTLNSLVASDFYLTPVSAEYLPLEGLKRLQGTVAKVRKLNPDLKPLGVCLTMKDKRESITQGVEELVREELNDLVFDTAIRVNTKFKSAPAHKQTIFEFENSKGKGTEDYGRLTDEVLSRLEGRF